MKYLFSILILCFVNLASGQLYSLFEAKTYDSDLGALNYRLLSPDKTITEKVPVIVFLHGAGERGDNNQAQLAHVMTEFVSAEARHQYPCYIIAPQCPKENWWVATPFTGDWDIKWREKPSDIQTMVMSILEEVLKMPNADPNRIYIGGLSMGGMGTFDFIAHWPNKFAAAFPICGWGNPDYAEKIKQIPLWAFHGADDPVVPPSGSIKIVNALREVGGKPIITLYEGVKHNSWELPFTENNLVFDWLFAQQK